MAPHCVRLVSCTRRNACKCHTAEGALYLLAASQSVANCIYNKFIRFFDAAIPLQSLNNDRNLCFLHRFQNGHGHSDHVIDVMHPTTVLTYSLVHFLQLILTPATVSPLPTNRRSHAKIWNLRWDTHRYVYGLNSGLLRPMFRQTLCIRSFVFFVTELPLCMCPFHDSLHFVHGKKRSDWYRHLHCAPEVKQRPQLSKPGRLCPRSR